MASDYPPSDGGPEDAQSVEWMDPAQIKYSQDKISSFFARRPLQALNGDCPRGMLYVECLNTTTVHSIEGTLQQLRGGNLTVDQIQHIRVCKHNGEWYSLDNRRLWVFKEYGRLIPVRIEETSKEFFQKFDTTSKGETVKIENPSQMRAEWQSQSLQDIVLPWSLENITNDRSFVNKVFPIPVQFSDLKSYYNAFRWPVIEDTRSQIAESLEGLGEAPYISLSSVTLKDSDPIERQLKYFKLSTQKGKNFVERNAKDEPWKPKATDVVILSTLVPEDVDDLRRSGEYYLLAVIKSEDFYDDSGNIHDDDGPLSFWVNAYAPRESPEYVQLLEEERSWYAISLGNLATKMRIWQAINPEFEALSNDREVVKETLLSESFPKNTTSDDDHEVKDEFDELIEAHCHKRKLNSSQTKAVAGTVTSVMKDTGDRVRLIQGPPGTGKTSTISVVIAIMSCLKDRIIVCAPTNRAISEVAERVLLHLKKDLAETSQFSDFMSLGTAETMHCSRLEVGDVLLIGNADRLDADGMLGDIFLPTRAQRLLNALAPTSGWTHSSQVVVHFLQSALAEFDLYLQLRKENPDSDEEVLDFLQFVRRRMNLIGKDMMRSGNIICNDLPSKMLISTARKSIKASCDALGRLLEALARENLTDEKLRRCFTSDFQFDSESRAGFGVAGAVSIEIKNLVEAIENVRQFSYALKGPWSLAWVKELCLKNSHLVFSTTSSAGLWSVQRSGPFEYAVVDEAAQVVEAELAIVTQLQGLKRVLLVGDPRQLQALTTSQIAKDCGYSRSLFERLQNSGHPCYMLDVQYRMHPAISHFPNQRFYQGAVCDGPNVQSEGYKKPYQNLYGPYAFIDVEDGEEERDEMGKSWLSQVEAEVVRHIISNLRAVAREEMQDLDVGVISPYRGQINCLKKRLHTTNSLKDHGNDKIPVKTVDGFQGGEKDVIIFSAVRANAAGHIGFVEDARRLNVALTRGRYCVWIIGCASTLCAQNEMWRALVKDCKTRNCYRDAGSDPSLKKLICRVKTELEQVASLLHPDSVLFRDTLWQVIFSKEFKDTITKVKLKHNRQKMLGTILHLANGRRSHYPTGSAAASERYRKMIHVQPTAGGLMLVWTVDVQKRESIRQVIKVWDAVQFPFVAGIIRRLESAFSTYSPFYIDRCSTIKVQKGTSRVVIPESWKQHSSFVWHNTLSVNAKDRALIESNDLSTLEKSTVEESIRLMKFYKLTSGIARQLLTAEDGSQLELVMEVNEEEAAIVSNPFSTFILGRSGTGKTTVITTRLLLKERALASRGGEKTAYMASDMMSLSSSTQVLRQVIVTVSPKLCAAIKHHIVKASRTQLAEECGPNEADNDHYEDMMLDDEGELKLMGGIPDTLINISSDVFPLVITFRKLLHMIDGSLNRPFLMEGKPQSQAYVIHDHGEGGGFESDSKRFTIEPVEENEGETANGSSAELSDSDEDSEYFSFDEDLGDESRVDGGCSGVSMDQPGNQRTKMIEVTYERFTSLYWPRFSQDLVKWFDSSAVFAEIISAIKGSVEALDADNGRLNKQQYLSMAMKRSSSFDEQQRHRIYSIFLAYEKLKLARREYDLADYCMHLYAQLEGGDYQGVKFHYVYVDEVQDFTMAQIALFKYLCMDAERGFVFAGDTAQTIARGVSFRFEDIRNLFYTKFLERGDIFSEKNRRLGQRPVLDGDCQNGDENPASSPPGKAKSDSENGTIPRMADLLHLSQNFRTHVGIVNMANSIVDLLHHFFPSAVDKLEPESSLLVGAKPVFLEQEEQSEFVTNLFGLGGVAGAGGCDFGAQQVILVRDLETKRRMIEGLGKRGLVMSVLECKGLEFQDVLLYNFFTDSPLENKWRVIYSYLAELSTFSELDLQKISFPRFDERKHYLLMSELKQLYVVITRARQRLWMYDESPASPQPMLDFWRRSGLVEVKRMDNALIQTIQGKSTPEEWRKRGIQMFNDHIYDMAQLSFERAGDTYRANWANAALLQQGAEILLQTDKVTARQRFQEAATLFLTLEKGDAAAKCYEKMGEFKTAGTIYRHTCKPPRLNDAGGCFTKAKCWREAAETYKSFSVEQCLSACYNGKLFDLGLNMIAEWEQHLTNSVSSVNGASKTASPSTSSKPLNQENLEISKFLKKCALYYHNQGNTEMMMKFVRRFWSITSQKTFLKRRDYYDQLMEVEEGEGNFLKAAEIAEEKGDLKHASKLLVRGGRQEEALEKLIAHARFEMLWIDGRRGWPLLSTPYSDELLQIASAVVSSSENIRTELLQELELLEGNGLKLWDELKDSGNLRLQLMAARQVIDSTLIQCKDLGANFSVLDRSYDIFFGNLFSVWDFWSTTVVSLIQALNRAQRRRETVVDEKLLDCSNAYLGATRHSRTELFFLPNANACWLKKSEVALLPNQGYKCHVTSSQLFSWAEIFWAEQLWKTGLEMIEMLDKVLFGGKERNVQNARIITSSAELFPIRGKQLCKLYLITQVMVENVTPNHIQVGHMDLTGRLECYALTIFDVSFPYYFNKENFQDVLNFREEARNIYDNMATCFLQGRLISLSQQPLRVVEASAISRVGWLLVLIPMLSTQWRKKYDTAVTQMLTNSMREADENVRNSIREVDKNLSRRQSKGVIEKLRNDRRGMENWLQFRKDPVPMWLRLWEGSVSMYNMAEYFQESNSCLQWLNVIDMYCINLTSVHRYLREFVHPAVFMHMLEKGIVLKLACHCHLHGLFVPESLVHNYMSNNNLEDLYSAVLNMPCTKGCYERAADSILSSILNMLNSTDGQFERWFTEFDVDWYSELPGMTFRLVMSALTVSVNCDTDQIWRITIQGLSYLIRSNSPLLTGLPFEFMKEMKEVLTAPRFTSYHQLRVAFTRAMETIGDPVLVLKWPGRPIARWAHDIKLRKMIITSRRREERGWRFRSNYQSRLKHQDSVRCIASGESSQKDTSEAIEALPGTSPLVVSNDSDEDGELLEVKDDMSIEESSRGGTSLEPRNIPPGHVSIGEGLTLHISIKKKLLEHLHAARQRLAIELTPSEKYERDTRSLFRKWKILGRDYSEVFLAEACPLKAEADKWLQRLETSLQVLKERTNVADIEDKDELLDEIGDAQEMLQKAVVHLDPSNDQHKVENLDWLEGTLAEVKRLITTRKEQFEYKMRLLEKAGKDLKQLEAGSSCPATKSVNKRPQKSKNGKQKKSGKKKGRK